MEFITEGPADVALESLSVDPNSVTITGTGSEVVTVTASPGNHTDTITATSANTGVATANYDKTTGKVTITGVAAGDTTVTVAGTKATDKTATITVNVQNDQRDNATLVADAKTALEEALADYTVAQADAGDETAAQNTLTAKVNEVLEGTGTGVTATAVTISEFNHATAGTKDSPDGSSGSFKYSITLTKGTETATVTSGEGSVTITPTAHTKTPQTYSLKAAYTAMTDSSVSPAWEKNDILPVGYVWNSPYFKVATDPNGSTTGMVIRTDKNSIDTGAPEHKHGIEFTVTSKATKVDINCSTSGSSNYAGLTLVKMGGDGIAANGTPQPIESVTTNFKKVSSLEGADVTQIAEDANGTIALLHNSKNTDHIIYKDLGPGTYRIYSPINNNPDTSTDEAETGRGSKNTNKRGVRLYDITVVEEDAEALAPISGTATGVTMSKSSLTLAPDGTAQLTATVTPEDALDRRVTWSSSNEAAATVADGKVTAVAAGEATITATSVVDNNVKGECAVTVESTTRTLTFALPDAGVAIADVKEVKGAAEKDLSLNSQNQVTVDKSASVTFTLTPDEGYAIKNVDGATQTSTTETSATYTVDAGNEDATVTVTLRTPPTVSITSNKTETIQSGTEADREVTLTVTPAPAGSVLTVSYKKGEDGADTTITPESGVYKVTLPDETADYTFTASYTAGDDTTAATATCTVHVIHSTATAHNVTSTWTHIAAEPDPTQVADQTKLEITLTPDAGYALPESATVTMNGAEQTGAYSKDTSTVTINSVTGDVVITAAATAIPYNITYTLNDGQNAAGNPATYTVETNDITLAEPTKEGYTFTGWTYGDVTTPTKNVTIEKGSTGDKAFTANWEKTKYAITVTVDGGNGTASANVNEAAQGTEITITATPAGGYELGSITSADVIIGADGKFTMPEKAVTVTVTFKAEESWPDPEGLTFKLDVSEEKAALTQTTELATAETLGKFTVHPGGDTKYILSKQTFPDGYTGKVYISFNGANQKKLNERIVTFSTEDKAVVRVYWLNNTNKTDTKLNLVDTTKSGDNAFSSPVATSTGAVEANKLYITDLKAPAAGNYGLAFRPQKGFIYRVEVFEGVDAAPEIKVLDASKLQDAIDAAEAKLKDVKTSTNGNDVLETEKWATEEAINTLTAAIEAAKGKLTSKKQDEIDAATKTLTDATAAFVPQAGKNTGKDDNYTVTGVTLKKGSEDAGEAAALEVGGTLTLTADVAVTPADGTDVVWESSDPDVATVAGGLITAVKEGKTTVTATSLKDMSKKDSIEITVAHKVLTLDKMGVGLEKDGTVQLSGKVMLGGVDTEDAVTWTSSDDAVATVANGLVTAVAPKSATEPGVAVITATGAGASQTCVVVVAPTDAAAGVKAAKTFTLTPSTGYDGTDGTPIDAGTQFGTDNYFTIAGDGFVGIVKQSTDLLQPGAKGTSGVQFTVTAAEGQSATVTATVRSSGSNNYSAVGLVNTATGELVNSAAAIPTAAANTGIQPSSSSQIVVFKGTADATVVWKGLKSGTYQLVSPARDNSHGFADGAATANDSNRNDTNARGFRMKSLSVVQGEAAPAEYTVTLNGTHLASQKVNNDAYTAPVTFQEGVAVTVKVAAETGYVLPDTVTVEGLAAEAYTWDKATGTLTIPVEKFTANVTVTIEAVEAAKYAVTVTAAENGTVTVAPTGELEAGTEVTITATPAGGYEVASISVAGASGAVTVTDHKFTMPAEAVTVTVTFRAVGSASTVDRKGLEAALAAAEELKTSVAVSTNGADVEKGHYWVTSAVMDPLTQAIAAAKALAADADQAAVDAAAKALKDASAAVTNAAQEGTKEPTGSAAKTYILRGEEVLADLKAKGKTVTDSNGHDLYDPMHESTTGTEKEVIEKQGTEGFFTIYTGTFGTNNGTKIEYHDKTFADEVHETGRINFNGGANVKTGEHTEVIGFTTKDAATVKIWFMGGNSSDTNRYMVLLKEDGSEAAKGTVAVTSANTAIDTLTLTEGGTYYLGASPKKNTIYRVEVTVGGTGNTPTTVDKSTLTAAIDAANTALNAIPVSTDGADVATTDKWVSQADHDTFAAAITKAQATKLDGKATAEDVAAAVTALNTAKTAFEAAQKNGTKGGGTNPPASTVNKDALTAAVNAAKEEIALIRVDTDAANVNQGTKWVTQAEKDAYQTAITAAETIRNKTSATQEEVDKAVSDLATAKTTFEAAQKDGTKDIGSKQTLLDDIAAAKKAAGSVKVAKSASSVAKGTKWVTQEEMDAYQTAIEAAQKVADQADATSEEIAAAVTAITEAGKTFTLAQKDGTKTGSSGGTSSGSSAGSGSGSGAGSTTTQPDGSTVSTKTDRNGTVTTTIQTPTGVATQIVTKTDGTVSQTVTQPDGAKAETVTQPGGDMTITATSAKGEVMAEVKIPATIPAATGFVDVPEGHWAEKAINEMAGLELVKGVDEKAHIYDMVSPVTRGAVATILYRFANGKDGLEADFSDVSSDVWYADAVAWASHAGVVNGYADGTFGADGSITREQLAVMIARFAKLLGLDTEPTGDLSAFGDAGTVQDWAVDGLTWCVQNGIINGKGNGVLDPGASATRAEAAVMLDRFVEFIK